MATLGGTLRCRQINAPRLRVVGGYIKKMEVLENVEISATEFTGGNIAENCPELRMISFPNMVEFLAGGRLTQNCPKIEHISFPLLERLGPSMYIQGWIGGYGSSSLIIDMPSLRETPDYAACMLGASKDSGTYDVTINLGNAQDANITFVDYNNNHRHIKTVTIMSGFRGNLRMADYKSLTAECLHNLIQNLGDNTGNAALALTIGATNIAKISADDIALAQAKNYTIS